jgi:very-short-patch-repair endonuclease
VIVEPYTVDFVCFEAKRVIEADGGQHSERVLSRCCVGAQSSGRCFGR